MALEQRNDSHLPAPRANFFCAHDRLLAIIAAFDQHVGLESRHDREWRILIEDHHGVDGLQRRQNIRAIILGSHRALRSLVEAADRRIAIDADDQGVTESARRREEIDVTGMQQVEYAIRKHDATGLTCSPGPGIRQRQNFRPRRPNDQKSASACGLKKKSRDMTPMFT